MGRIIGLIGCTCLVIAVLRLSNMEHVNSTLKGGVDRSPAARKQTARENYRSGKELYLRGRYNDAVLALEAAVSAPAGLSPMEKQQADDYLRRTQAKLSALPMPASRGQSPDDEAAFAKPVRGWATDEHGDAVRTRVERLMSQAQQASKQGNRAEARKLAQQAVALAKSGNLKFDSRETTPAQLLARIDSAGKPTVASGAIRQAGGATSDEGPVELVAGEIETVETTEADFSPWAEEEAKADAEPGEESEISGDLSQEQLARQLVASAREDLKAGRFAEARRKALQADELDVPWSLLDDQPILILEAVDDRTDSTTLAATKSSARRPADAPNVDAGARKSALGLLKEARRDLDQGQPETAREKAVAAQELKVVYKTFDDRPELVMQDIDAQISASSSPDNVAEWDAEAETESTVTPEAQQRKQQAKALLVQARKALEAGDADAAREFAVQADELNVPLGVFDDTPDHVLADIARTVEKRPAETGAAAPRSEGANLAAKKLAIELLKQSRALLAAGRLEDAMLKAKKAENLGVTFDVLEDRPESVLAEIEAAMDSHPVASRTQTSDPDVRAAASGGNPAFETPAAVEHADGQEVLAPIGSSAVECYNRGMTELKKGDRAAAYDAFVAAHQTGQKLDRVRAQRLQDFLRELAPRGRNVRPANHQISDTDPEAEFPTVAGDEPNMIESVDQQLRVKHDRMRSDVLNAVFKAERLRDKDPEKGVTVIDEAIVQVEESDLTGEGRASLLRTLERTRTGLETTITQQEPNLKQKRQNEEVLAEIDRKSKNHIRVEQETAKLIEEFNELMEQRRYAEAEAKAKMAKELNPHEPAVTTALIKAQIARKVASNEKLREDKDEAIWNMFDNVEQSMIPNVDDKNPLRHGPDWADITKRRDGKYGVDNRNRSDLEIQIEKSLGKRISLHEDQVPLSEVLNKIGILAGFSMYIDDQGLADENVVATETPVTINVEAITVKSALNLLLERYNLGYTIQDEVLKITSRMRQQGDLVARTYNVADLVVPIPSVVSAAAPSLPGLPTGVTNGTGGAQFSVPANGGQAMAQIGPQADLGPLGLGGNSRGAATQARQELDFDSLNELIVHTVAPDSWDAVGGQATIRHYEQTLSLVIRQTQKIHEEIADLLGQLRRLQDLQVTVEVRFVTVSDRFFERVGLDFDFNVPDSLGPAEFDNIGNPIPRFGSVFLPAAGQNGQAGQQAGQNQGGQNQQGQQAGQAQQGAGGNFLTPDPSRSLTPGKFRSPTVVGLSSPGQFQQNFDIPFQQGSFEVGVPTFGGFNPNAGVQVGFAILSDIEAFFFIQAAQADQRNNLLFAPKVTLFNGQSGTVVDQVQRPFVISLIPTVGFFSTGFQPVISVVPDGVQLSVTAVISADRRYVRLTVLPFFTNITDVFTFSFIGGTSGGQQGQQGQLGQQGQQGQQGQGFGGGQFGGGQQFGIGGSMGTSQLLQSSLTQIQGQNQGGQQQQGQQNQQGAGVTVTVQQPVVEVITVSTTVSVPDGGTVLLGGVKRLREGRAMAGVPILNKIPYINRLFKNTGVGRETESLMLMVTPRIIIQEEEEELLGIPTN